MTFLVNPDFVKRAVEDDSSEDLQKECDKLAVQVTELARKNRAYILEAKNYRTLLAEANEALRQMQAENEKLKQEIREETEQRKNYKKKWYWAVKDLDRERWRSNDKRALERSLMNQTQQLNAERAKVSKLNREIRDLQQQVKAAEEHDIKLTSLLAKF